MVYSTDRGRICPGCQRQKDQCVCRDRSRSRSGSGSETDSVTVSRETKGRKGAGVTLIKGLPLADAVIKKLAKTLKTKCGVGGAVKNGVIELQGEHREKVCSLLEEAGFQVKRSGG